MWKKVSSVADISVGDVVRVALDAYSNEIVAELHNGRIGVVKKISGGDVIFKSIDDIFPDLPMVHHPPHNLEKLEKLENQ